MWRGRRQRERLGGEHVMRFGDSGGVSWEHHGSGAWVGRRERELLGREHVVYDWIARNSQLS